MVFHLFSFPYVYEALPWASSNEIQIPKPNQQEGLGIDWPASETDMDKLKKYLEVVKAKM